VYLAFEICDKVVVDASSTVHPSIQSIAIASGCGHSCCSRQFIFAQESSRVVLNCIRLWLDPSREESVVIANVRVPPKKLLDWSSSQQYHEQASSQHDKAREKMIAKPVLYRPTEKQ
jgi:hypothetical protein